MKPFLRKFFPEVYTRMEEDTKISNYCKFDSQLLTLFTSSLYLAGLVATYFASLTTKAYGRKPSIIIGGAAFLAGAALNGAALTIHMLILGRVLLGVGVGFANQVCTSWLDKISSSKFSQVNSHNLKIYYPLKENAKWDRKHFNNPSFLLKK